jgi:hypothetical protein
MSQLQLVPVLCLKKKEKKYIPLFFFRRSGFGLEPRRFETVLLCRVIGAYDKWLSPGQGNTELFLRCNRTYRSKHAQLTLPPLAVRGITNQKIKT